MCWSGCLTGEVFNHALLVTATLCVPKSSIRGMFMHYHGLLNSYHVLAQVHGTGPVQAWPPWPEQSMTQPFVDQNKAQHNHLLTWTRHICNHLTWTRHNTTICWPEQGTTQPFDRNKAQHNHLLTWTRHNKPFDLNKAQHNQLTRTRQNTSICWPEQGTTQPFDWNQEWYNILSVDLIKATQD